MPPSLETIATRVGDVALALRALESLGCRPTIDYDEPAHQVGKLAGLLADRLDNIYGELMALVEASKKGGTV